MEDRASVWHVFGDQGSGSKEYGFVMRVPG